jgi:outer membrane protein OmpA-like peptidoglycan-associated protein
MTVKREKAGPLNRGTIKRTVCAPYRPFLEGPRGTNLMGCAVLRDAAARDTNAYPVLGNGDGTVWTPEYFREIHDRLEDLVKTRDAALRGYADEEMNAFLIYFDPGSASIRDQDDVLARALAAIERSPNADIVICGHTDRHGPAFRNDNLSSERATNVAKLLRQRGVPWRRMECSYYGARHPRQGGISSEMADQMNRRVQIVIKG